MDEPTKPADAVWQRGVVDWFDQVVRHGFINGDDGRDAFIHLSTVQRNKLNPVDIRGGVHVEYQTIKKPNKRSPQVTNLKVIG
jgi:cold shock CspA family protein